MKFPKLILLAMLSLALATAPAESQQSDSARRWTVAKRSTLAINYPDNKNSSVDMRGTGVHSNITGRAEAKRDDGRTRVKLRLENLPHPQSLGAYYTTYVVWAVAPEGQADNLGELEIKSDRKSEIEVTTPYQTFGLIATAEPHGLVKYPGPLVIAENLLRKDTKGEFTASTIEYRGDSGVFYEMLEAERSQASADYATPLSILGARRAVEIARRAGAETFAATELKEAEAKLTVVEQVWPKNERREEKFNGDAREVMRLAEAARAATVERVEAARLDAERRAAGRAIDRAQSEAERARTDASQARTEASQARTEAERARQLAEEYRAAMARSETELAQAKQRAQEAQSEADRAKANEEVARLEAERARLERDQARQRLQISIAEILETRREARGLIVNLSDVLFDFNKATLKPGAKEKLSKLAGVLLAYTGDYKLEIEGHTDSVGSDAYNQKLSEDRAASVREYLAGAGLPATKIAAVRGFGKTRPVTTNDTAEGRQMNRRVEIVIADVDVPPTTSRK